MYKTKKHSQGGYRDGAGLLQLRTRIARLRGRLRSWAWRGHLLHAGRARACQRARRAHIRQLDCGQRRHKARVEGGGRQTTSKASTEGGSEEHQLAHLAASLDQTPKPCTLVTSKRALRTLKTSYSCIKHVERSSVHSPKTQNLKPKTPTHADLSRWPSDGAQARSPNLGALGRRLAESPPRNNAPKYRSKEPKEPKNTPGIRLKSY